MYRKKIYSKGFLIPALLLYIALFVIPCLISFGYSLTNWNSMSANIKFVGLENFKKIFSIQGDYLTAKRAAEGHLLPAVCHFSSDYRDYLYFGAPSAVGRTK